MRLLLSAVAVLCVWLAVGESASAQTVARDYVVDRHAFYSPEDYERRGLMYHIHTGQAGFYRQCDDDWVKRYSPYITWQQRPDRRCKPALFRPVGQMLDSIDEKLFRFRAGQGACRRDLRTGACLTCQGACRSGCTDRGCESTTLQLMPEAASSPAPSTRRSHSPEPAVPQPPSELEPAPDPSRR